LRREKALWVDEKEELLKEVDDLTNKMAIVRKAVSTFSSTILKTLYE
jgi:hypothetical protein